MEKSTTYKRTLSGSVGAGLGSVFNRAGGKTYYILEHKVSSKYHKAGEAQEIIVDQIEIGRDYRCQVQFDDKFETVSRRHAAIVRDGDNWKLIQLSKTNKTFLNGHSVENEWYLQNGDEIQLSVNGPKLGFIIPQGNKAKTGSIALSRRLSLFRQQALRPYKAAMTAMACVIALLLICGGGAVYYQHIKIRELIVVIVDKDKAFQDSIDAARIRAEEAERKANEMRKEIKNLKVNINDLKKSLPKNSGETVVVPIIDGTGNAAIDKCMPSIYYVMISKIEVTCNGITETYNNIGHGSGFLLSDGRFVTARHVVEPWLYPQGSDDKFSMYVNIKSTSGCEVVCYLDAYSPDGKHLTFKSTDAVVDRNSVDRYELVSGESVTLPKGEYSDWAFFRTNSTTGLRYDESLSKSLPIQAELTILGYPLSFGANSSKTDVHPILSKALVAKQGLDNGLILTTDTGFEHGNSGGPVFVTTTKGGELIVVGIVEGGAGRSTGAVVPIGNLK